MMWISQLLHGTIAITAFVGQTLPTSQCSLHHSQMRLDDYVLWRCVSPDYRQSMLIDKARRGKYLLLEKHSLEDSEPQADYCPASFSPSVSIENLARWACISIFDEFPNAKLPASARTLLMKGLRSDSAQGILACDKKKGLAALYVIKFDPADHPYGAEFRIVNLDDGVVVASVRSFVALPKGDFSGFVKSTSQIAYCIVRDESQNGILWSITEQGKLSKVASESPSVISASPNGLKIAMLDGFGSDSWRLRLVSSDLAQQQWSSEIRLEKPYGNYCPDITWSTDGLIVSVCAYGSPDEKAQLTLFDVSTGRVLGIRRMRFSLIHEGSCLLATKDESVEAALGINKHERVQE